MMSKEYVAIESSQPELIFTEEEEKWLRDHPLLPEERQLERLQRMLNEFTKRRERK